MLRRVPPQAWERFLLTEAHRKNSERHVGVLAEDTQHIGEIPSREALLT